MVLNDAPENLLLRREVVINAPRDLIIVGGRNGVGDVVAAEDDPVGTPDCGGVRQGIVSQRCPADRIDLIFGSAVVGEGDTGTGAWLSGGDDDAGRINLPDAR